MAEINETAVRKVGGYSLSVRVIGQMDNKMDHTFESANRVYDSLGIAPTLPTCCGGGHCPKVLVKV